MPFPSRTSIDVRCPARVSAFVHTACLAVFTNDFAALLRDSLEGRQLRPFVINGKCVGFVHIEIVAGHFVFISHSKHTNTKRASVNLVLFRALNCERRRSDYEQLDRPGPLIPQDGGKLLNE